MDELVADKAVATRLEGRRIPRVRLVSASGSEVDLGAAAEGVLVLYVYPRTAVPGRRLPKGWEDLPGARGCTAESRAFRDLESELRLEGAVVMGLSAQPFDEQRQFAGRERISYPLLNDAKLELAAKLGLPTFDVDGMTLYQRLTLIVVDGCVAKVLDRNLAAELHPVAALEWLRLR